MNRSWANWTFREARGDLKRLTGEIVVGERASAFLSDLPDPDPVLRKTGQDIRVYRDLLSDAHVGACVQSRKAGVKSLLWDLTADTQNSPQIKTLRDVLNSLKHRSLINEILDAVLYGFSALEVIWEVKDNLFLPARVVGKPQEWFTFDQDRRLCYKEPGMAQPTVLPDRKILLARHNPTYTNPYGEKIVSRCFWPLTFKRGGLKFWAVFVEKYGMPYMIGKVPPGTDDQRRRELLAMLDAMVQDAVAVIDDTASITIADGAQRASSDLYNNLLDFCNAEISKAIIGQTLTTEVKQGSLAAAQAHMKIRQDIVDDDKQIVEEVINELLSWIIEFNFPDLSCQYYLYAQEDVDMALAQRDKLLAETGQIRFTKSYWMRSYGFRQDDIEVVAGAPVKNAGTFERFAEEPRRIADTYPDQSALDQLVNSLGKEELQKQMEGILAPVLELLAKGESYEDVLAALATAYPDMDDTALAGMVERAVFVSEAWGLINAGS